MTDTLLVNGTDLANYARDITYDSWGSTTGAAEPRGGDWLVPNRPGEIAGQRVAGARTMLVSLNLVGTASDGSWPADSVTQFNDNLRALKQLIWTDSTDTLTLTRRQNFTTGSEDHTCAARYVSGLEPQLQGPGENYGKIVLQFKLLEGLWYGTQTAVSSPGTVTVSGEARTNNMTITIASGVTLANSTTGASLTYSGAGTATIDVLNWTATSGGVDVSGSVSWPVSGHTFWFDLAPGSNVLTGTATIDYYPAYL